MDFLPFEVLVITNNEITTTPTTARNSSRSWPCHNCRDMQVRYTALYELMLMGTLRLKTGKIWGDTTLR